MSRSATQPVTTGTPPSHPGSDATRPADPGVETATVEEFAELCDDFETLELIDGRVIRTTKPGMRHGRTQALLGAYLFKHAKQHGGEVLGEVGCRLIAGEATVRAPDVAYLSPEQAELARDPKFATRAPVLVVEVTSPSDRAGDVREKARWWLKHGVKQVWVVDDPSKTVEAYYADGTARVFGAGETVVAEGLLTGFTLPVDELFD